MREIGFVGGYDKLDLILYTSRVMVELGNRVLIIDGTMRQKSRYVVPAINPSRRYLTNHEGIDVAIGFQDIEDIKVYLGYSEQQDLPYDVVCVDCDTFQAFEAFELKQAYKNYFVTAFDNYSLKKGIEIINKIEGDVILNKICFTQYSMKEEDDYLEFLTKDSNISWTETKIDFPIENGDLAIIYENQRLNRMKTKKLSVQFKDGIAHIVKEIIEEVSDVNIRRIIKNMDKGA